MKPWTLTDQEIVNILSTSPQSGLTKAEALHRIQYFGPNVLAADKRLPWWIRFLAQFRSSVVTTLLIATVISTVAREFIDAAAILVIVVINAIIGFIQEANAEAAVEALKKLAVPRCRVMRDGAINQIAAAGVCPGDILILEAGDYVAADARVLIANQLSADESVLTGESLPVRKSTGPLPDPTVVADRLNMLFAGTAISTGTARAVATSTGMQTEIGRIASMLERTPTSKTPLQQRLAEVSSKLLRTCAFVVLAVAAFGIIRGEGLLAILMTSISLAVAAIPEGLPTVVTLALALAVRRMTQRNAIVRHLPAVETLGSTDVICTDKTGTLTTGNMRVRDIFTVQTGWQRKAPSQLVESAVLCSNAAFDSEGHASGDPTEIALLHLAKATGIEPASLTAANPRISEWSFDGVRKRMSVAVETAGNVVIHVKGAPESVLPLCIDPADTIERTQHAADGLAREGMRLLAIAERRTGLSTSEFRLRKFGDTQAERELHLLGLVAIADPPRPESSAAVAKCRIAGVKVVMITGDHPATATAIAKELGIIEPGVFERVLTGPEIESMSQQELKNVVSETAVYARVSPEDKLRIVEAWQSLGMTVAMTGDGVNDAPALKAASIGIAMGKSGTEVARQASSMILTDDNFSTIVSAVEQGRGIYGNIRRTIQYLLSGNLAEILVMLGAAVAGWPVPLAPIHLLWINLVTDGLPSLALAAEPVPDNYLKVSRKPSPRNFFDRRFNLELLFVSLTTTALTLAVYGYSLITEGEFTARTHVFSFLVFSELFRSFACRSENKTYFELGVRSNPYHLAAVAVPVFFQLAVHHFEPFQTVFKVSPIAWSECFILICLTLLPVTAIELSKWLKEHLWIPQWRS